MGRRGVVSCAVSWPCSALLTLPCLLIQGFLAEDGRCCSGLLQVCLNVLLVWCQYIADCSTLHLNKMYGIVVVKRVGISFNVSNANSSIQFTIVAYQSSDLTLVGIYSKMMVESYPITITFYRLWNVYWKQNLFVMIIIKAFSIVKHPKLFLFFPFLSPSLVGSFNMVIPNTRGNWPA